MKRDCGEGELIPIKWEVVTCFGESDDEMITKHPSFNSAKGVFDSLVVSAKTVPCSKIGLYAIDKHGYANCILSFIHTKQGEFCIDDRTSEL